mgnify:CR=1 FL=1
MFHLKRDSRDKHAYIKYGSTNLFPDEYLLDTDLVDAVQPPGNNQCAAYTVCDMASDQTGVVYDINDFFARIPGSDPRFGANLREAMGEAVKKGLLTLGGVLVKDWSSYWRADSGPMDAFDNTRSAFIKIKEAIGKAYPAGAGTPWYAEWNDGGKILNPGNTYTNNHAWVIEGWTQKNGQPMLQVEAHVGYKLYMNREIYNKAISAIGAGAFVLSTDAIDEKIKLNIMQKMIDSLLNLIAVLKAQLLAQQPVPVPTPTPVPPVTPPSPKRDLVNEMCLAIQEYEGWYPGSVSYRNNNPGNIRSVSGPFLVFPTYEKGFAYLKDYVTRACTGKHAAYKPTMTVAQFFAVYAPTGDNNQPDKYADWVCKKLKILTTTKLEDLIF